MFPAKVRTLPIRTKLQHIDRIRTAKTAASLRSFSRGVVLGRELCASGFPIPGQEFIEPLDAVVVDASEHVSEPGLGIDIVEPCRLDQRVHQRGPLSAAIAT